MDIDGDVMLGHDKIDAHVNGYLHIGRGHRDVRGVLSVGNHGRIRQNVDDLVRALRRDQMIIAERLGGGKAAVDGDGMRRMMRVVTYHQNGEPVHGHRVILAVRQHQRDPARRRTQAVLLQQREGVRILVIANIVAAEIVDVKLEKHVAGFVCH